MDALPFQVFKNQAEDVFLKIHILAQPEIMDFICELLNEYLDHTHTEVRLHAHSSPFWP